MSFLNIFNQSNLAGGGQTFAEQATQTKQALTGKEETPGTAVAAPSQVADQAANITAQKQKQATLGQAQQVQQQAGTAFQQQQTEIKVAQDQRDQQMSQILSNTQQKINQIHQKLSEQGTQLGEQEYNASIAQLEFLHNQADRKFSDQCARDGEVRRLDDATQMKKALMFAAFNTQITQLQNNIKFQTAIQADERTFQQYLGTIAPEMAIQVAVEEYKLQQSGEAIKGMVSGVAKAAPDIGQYMATPSPTPKPSPTPTTIPVPDLTNVAYTPNPSGVLARTD